MIKNVCFNKPDVCLRNHAAEIGCTYAEKIVGAAGRSRALPAELPGVVLSVFEHRLDRPNLSLVHRRAGVGPPTVGIPRAQSHRAGIPSALNRRGAAP